MSNKVMAWEFKNQWIEERSVRTLVDHTPKIVKVHKKEGIAASLRKNFCTGSVSGNGSQVFHKKELRDKIIKTTMTLERVLQDDELMRALNHYVERTHTSENLHFWIDVEVYQNLYWKPMKTLGLYDTMMRKRQSQIRSFAKFFNTRHSIDPSLFALDYKPPARNGKNAASSQIFKRVEDYNLQDALEHVQELPDIKIRASRTMLAEMIHDEYINENGVTTICIPFEIKQDIEDKLKMLQNNEIRETDEEIVTLFRAAQRHIFWDMTRDSFRRFLTSKEFKAVMNQRKANGDQFTVQTVHAPGQATANAFFNYISRKSITKWAMDKVYEVADAFAFTGSHRLGSISEKKPVHDSRGGSMKGAKKENGVKMASTLKGSRYDGTGLQGQKKSGSTSSYGSARSRRREVGVKMVSLRKPRSRKNIKDTPVASSQEKDKQSNKKGSGPKKETGAKMNASLNLAVKRKKSIQYAKLGGRLSSYKLGANTLVKQSSTSSDLGSLNEDKSVRVSATDAAKTSGAPKTQGVEKANDKDVAAEGVAEEKAKTTKEAKPKDNAHIGEGEAKKKAPKKAKTKSKGEVEPESSKKKKKKKKKGTGKEKAKSPRKK